MACHRVEDAARIRGCCVSFWARVFHQGRSKAGPNLSESDEIERAAAAFHDAWASWAAALLRADEEGSANVGDGRRTRWPVLIRTPYAELDDDGKEKDRQWARYALGLAERPR